MKSRIPLIVLALSSLLLLLALNAGAQPPPKKPPTAECTVSIDKIADCPDAGCGDEGDVDLNKAKNRIDIPAAADVKKKTLAFIRTLPQPAHWDTGADRTPLRKPGREGTPVEVQGFLKLAKPGGGESCNCGLTRRVDTDVHMVLVDEFDDDEQTSVTAEISPRIRANGHDNWLYKNVKELEGEYIRVTGWLMLDTKHIHQTHRLPNERPNKTLKRSTNWEVHPITKLEVCQKSVTACKANQGWEDF